MRVLRHLALLVVPAASILSGCTDDCERYCSRQADFVGTCLPEFGDTWSDVGAPDAEIASKGDFRQVCNEQVSKHISEEVLAICGEEPTAADLEANADADDIWAECDRTVADGIQKTCASAINTFSQSCTDYWRGTIDWTPGAYEPEEPAGDDDSAVGDDDSAGGDDDDDTARDDDSAGGDDDDDAVGDDDSVGDDDDDDTAGDDDSAAGDDDDSVGDDDSAAGDDDDSVGDDDSAAGDDDSAAP